MSISYKVERILSLDVFRGLTMMLMILVNSAGNLSPYPILEHADWDGCTLADLVFPFFLFIVGISLVISIGKPRNIKSKPDVYKSIIQRSIILFLLGLFLNIFPNPINLETIRIYGVLQRIALCYLVCSLIYINTHFKMQILIFLAIIGGYWFFMTQVPVPGFGVNHLTPTESWVSFFDQLLFSRGHLFAKTYDPEGFLSTIPAIASTLAGVLTGQLLLSTYPKKYKWFILLIFGLLFLILGGLWNYSFPINKDLWTSSFVLWTTGFALIVLALDFLVIDIWGYVKWTIPFKVFGVNALFIFILHVVLLKIQWFISIPLQSGIPIRLKTVISDNLFGHFNPQNASLGYSLTFLFLNFLVAAFLYRKKIFIQI